jgi:hypothetical protein
VQQPVGAQKSSMAKEPALRREIKRPALQIRDTPAGFRYQERDAGTIPNGIVKVALRRETQEEVGGVRIRDPPPMTCPIWDRRPPEDSCLGPRTKRRRPDRCSRR